MSESVRISELRRRVEMDPASTAFAQLAEELRRSGEYHEAVRYCRGGLARHPGYLAARVTLGRALLELGALDDAARELDLVLEASPNHLAAIRALAEIHHRQGRVELALEYYKRALALARFDPELDELGARLDAERAAPAPTRVDFDELLTVLGAPNAQPPSSVETLLSRSGGVAAAAPFVLRDQAPADPDDPFVRLERELRAHRSAETSAEERTIEALEAWLRALAAARQRSDLP